MDYFALRKEFFDIIHDDALLLISCSDGPIEYATGQVCDLHDRVKRAISVLRKERESRPKDQIIRRRLVLFCKLHGLIEHWMLATDYNTSSKTIEGLHPLLERKAAHTEEAGSLMAESFLLKAGLALDKNYFICVNGQRVIWLNGHGLIIPDAAGFQNISHALQNPEVGIPAYVLTGRHTSQGPTGLFDNNYRVSSENSPKEVEYALESISSEHTYKYILKLYEKLKEQELEGKRDEARNTIQNIELLEKYLNNEKNFQRKNEKDPSNEKARKAVAKSVKEALAKIEKYSPQIYEHFNSSIKAGTILSYKPAKEIEWVTEI